MVGQAITFQRFVPEKIDYAIERYSKESRRLYEVLDQQLEGQRFICGELSVADFAVFPWVRAHRMAKIPLDGLANLQLFMERMKARPAVQAGLSVGFPDTPLGREMGMRYSRDQKMTEEQKKQFMKGGSQMLHEKATELAKMK